MEKAQCLQREYNVMCSVCLCVSVCVRESYCPCVYTRCVLVCRNVCTCCLRQHGDSRSALIAAGVGVELSL